MGAEPGMLGFPGTLKGEWDAFLELGNKSAAPPCSHGLEDYPPEATLLLNLSFQGDPTSFLNPGPGRSHRCTASVH